MWCAVKENTTLFQTVIFLFYGTKSLSSIISGREREDGSFIRSGYHIFHENWIKRKEASPRKNIRLEKRGK